MSHGAKHLLDALDNGTDLPGLGDAPPPPRGGRNVAKLRNGNHFANKANASRAPSFAAQKRRLPNPPRFY